MQHAALTFVAGRKKSNFAWEMLCTHSPSSGAEWLFVTLTNQNFNVLKQNMDNSRNTGITIHYHEYFEFGIKTVLQNCPFGYVANLNAAVILSESASLHRLSRIIKIRCNLCFQKILWMGFRNSLPCKKLKVAVKPINRIFLNFVESCIFSCLLKLNNENGFTMPFLKYKHLNLKLSVFLARHTASMVTYCVTKMMLTVNNDFRQFFYFKIVASSEKE